MPRGKKACRRRRAARAERYVSSALPIAPTTSTIFPLTSRSRAVGSAPPGPRRVPGPQDPASAIAAYAPAAQDSSSSSDVAPSQDLDGEDEDEDEDDGDDDGYEAFSQHSPTSPDTQNMPGAYPNLEGLGVSGDGVGKGEGDESDDNAPDYDIELYGSVSSESEDEDVEGNHANITNTAMRDGASVAETSGPHLTVSVQVRKKEVEKTEEEVVKEKCPNWPHLPFVRSLLTIPFPIFLPLPFLPSTSILTFNSAVPTPTRPATAPTPSRTPATAPSPTSPSP